MDTSVLQHTRCDRAKCENINADLRCTRCKCVYYCSKECQKADWKLRHKAACAIWCKRFENTAIENIDLSRFTVVNYETLHPTATECSICCEFIKTIDASTSLSCNHVYCKYCLFGQQMDGLKNANCPVCNAKKDTFTCQYSYNNAVEFLRRARRFNQMNELVLHYCRMCSRELQALDGCRHLWEGNVTTTIFVDIVRFELLMMEGYSEDAITMGKSLLAQSSLENDRRVDVLTTLGQCYIRLQRYSAAEESLHEAKRLMDSIQHEGSILSKIIVRELSACAYFQGKYQEAIDEGETVVKALRHFEGGYKYIALSWKKLHNFDKAIETIQRAIRFEAPWDTVNKENLHILLTGLRAEKLRYEECGDFIGRPRPVKACDVFTL